MWIQEYTCGCSQEADNKKDLPGYCAMHGADERATYKAKDAFWVLMDRLKKQKKREVKYGS